MRKSITLLAFIFFTLSSYAQFNVKFRISDGIKDPALIATIERNTSLFLSELGSAFTYETLPDFTNIPNFSIAPEAVKTIHNTWELTGSFSCSVSELERKCIHKAGGGFQVRDIPIYMPVAEETGQEQEIVINFTSKGGIDAIHLIAPNKSIASILNSGLSVKEFSRRQIILDFVEQFRTAYNTKDLDFLQKVFSDNALIITGNVVKEIPSKDILQIPQEKIVYKTQTKTQYLEKLSYIFKINKYLNVEFKDYEIQQHPKHPELYGVVFFQDWNTQYYKDKGYVFLMIDFANEKEPIIHIRTWQPEKYNGKQLAREEIFRVTSFDITR